MKIKKVITCGCSFSDPTTTFTWPNQLEAHVKNVDPSVEFEHLGLPSQGQELIQKKTMLALMESLEKYKPEEIAVIVAWSGTERKSFYIDNTEEIKRISMTWDPTSIWWSTQFADLKNKLSNPKIMETRRGSINYNQAPGWYICAFGIDDTSISKAYFDIGNSNIGGVHTSIENIIMLQNTCKVAGVQLYQQFYMSYVYDDIENNKDHQLVGYLHKQLDYSTIVSKRGIHETVKTDDHRYLLSNVGVHPNESGHKKWLDEVLLPNLKSRGFFNG